jgi:GNAT superfamily N-acetyltransferase
MGMATAPDNRMKLRPMEPADLPGALLLSKAERWPHRLDDLQMMLSVGHGIVAEVAGEIIATTMWFPAGDSIATIGMMIVSPNFRGGGIGRLVLETALERAGCAAFELNSTQSAVPLYRRFDFQGVEEICQHQGAAFQVPVAALPAGERLRPIGVRDHERVQAMVEDATGLSRPAAIAHLLQNAQVVGLDRDGELIGAAFFRRFGHGYVVGPVVAPTIPQAKVLISHWLGSRAGEFTRLDVPVDSGLSLWLEELGLLRVDRMVTMVRGKPLTPQRSEVSSFAIFSQAFG